MRICPFALRAVSILTELILVPLLYLLTDVPSQWHFLSGCMFTGSDQRCVFIHVFLNRKCCVKLRYGGLLVSWERWTVVVIIFSLTLELCQLGSSIHQFSCDKWVFRALCWLVVSQLKSQHYFCHVYAVDLATANVNNHRSNWSITCCHWDLDPSWYLRETNYDTHSVHFILLWSLTSHLHWIPFVEYAGQSINHDVFGASVLMT